MSLRQLNKPPPQPSRSAAELLWPRTVRAHLDILLPPMSFVQKSVNTTGRLGADLIEWRERAGFNRDQAATATKIHSSIIRLWEEERWSDIDDVVYAERMLRAYVKFLGGSVPYTVQKFHSGISASRFERRPEDMLPRTRKIHLTDFLVGYKLIVAGGFLLVTLALGGYVFYQVRRISTPPILRLLEPADGSRLDEPSVRIHGQTDPDASVDVNGRQAFVSESGEFKLDLDIPRGLTLVIVRAKKRHGHKVTEARRVIYERTLPNIE